MSKMMPDKMMIGIATLWLSAALGGAYWYLKSPSDDDKIVMSCESEIMLNLKSPATVIFSDDTPSFIEKTESSLAQVSFHVDAENSFGALIRSNWLCKYFKTSDKVNVISAEITGN